MKPTHDSLLLNIYIYTKTNKINARVLIGQSAMVYCAGNPWKNRAKIRKSLTPLARDLQILLVFYQHPAWFISL